MWGRAAHVKCSHPGRSYIIGYQQVLRERERQRETYIYVDIIGHHSGQRETYIYVDIIGYQQVQRERETGRK